MQPGSDAGREEELFRLLEDLESRAGAEFAAEREADLADRVRAEYRDVSLLSRLRACVGREVSCQVTGVGTLAGRVNGVGPGWFEVDAEARTWLVSTAALSVLRGASSRSVPEEALRVTDRLGVGSRLRRLADADADLLVHLRDGASLRLRLLRVGADFVEARDETGQDLLLAWSAVAAVRADPAAG